ncbi:MAG TPA: amino acid adenylation domain-containing protein [Methylophaga aminisulfidivorans]|uniref:Amino acid adenylation domain-containing protein n=2 Tax=root TaxID=1 RepID=A0A7C1VQV3_9GAMM|nr:amino acid adenylation domain-containing protein [Methylophaga sp.]HEC75406.1 amino acid adenylation domain-containing protein [Methylophaga aminisulfidivorans]
MSIEVIKDANLAGVKLFLSNGKLKLQAAKGALTPEMRSKILASKEEIIKILKELDTFKEQDETRYIKPALYQDNKLALSFQQQGLWVTNELNQGSSEYNMPSAYLLEGELDLASAEKAIKEIIRRHEVLRTTYHNEEELLYCQVEQDIDFNIEQINLVEYQHQEREQKLNALLIEQANRAFDLSKDLLIRLSWIKLDQQRGILFFNMHHIASDGWSMELLSKEFFTLYRAYNEGNDSPLMPLNLQYADYAHWQREYLKGEVLDKQLLYWQKQLADVPVVHSLPLDYARPNKKQYQGAVVTGKLPATIAKQLLAVAKTYNLTPFMLMHAVLSLMLSRHSNSSDIVIGTPVANRSQGELEPLIGFFMNTLVLRVDTKHDTLADYFAHIRNVHLDALSHQDVAFEQLVGKLGVPRSKQHTPLFQIMMTTNTNYGLNETSAANSFQLPGLKIQNYSFEHTPVKYDLNIDMDISEQGLRLNWTYDVTLFSEQHIEQLNVHLCRLLTELSHETQTKQPPYSLAMLSEEETHHLVYELNDTATDYPKDKCIHELFEQQAVANPDNVAVAFENQTLTYQQLNEKANQLAHYLKDNHDIKPDVLVGLCIERSLEMVIGILGILKAGAAYVPLDPSYPKDRLDYMLDDAALQLVLSHSTVQASLKQFEGTIVTLDGFATLAQAQYVASSYPIENPDKAEIGLSSQNLAYMIYTSGSTGKPKGVLIEHQALFNRIDWMQSQYQMCHTDKVLQKTPYSFDVSVWEFVWPLAYGGQLVVARPEGHKDPEYLCNLIQKAGVTKLHFVPSMLEAILGCPEFQMCHSIKQVFCSGEALQLRHVEGFKAAQSKAELHNLYGPTEAAIDVSYWDCSQDLAEGVPIGKPINNTQLLILDSELNIVPKGVVGELHIGGHGLARGYLNRAAQTAERFINNPYYDSASANSSKRLYRTGDLVRYLADGNLEFIGRADDQVKIRGFRVELGEIEAQLTQQAKVDSAVVMIKQAAASQQLVGFIKPDSKLDEIEHEAFVRDVKAGISEYLPEYMVPSSIIVINQWPLTANGKVNRKMLLSMTAATQASHKHQQPTTESELKLSQLFEEILQIENIGIDDNFFQLGGDSILAIKLVGKARKLHFKLDINDVYEKSTVRQLAQSLVLSKEVIGGSTEVTGIQKLLPIHHETMFEKYSNRPEIYNYLSCTSLFTLPDNVGEDIIKQCAHHMLLSHDALRIRFIEKDDTAYGEYTAISQTMLDKAFAVEEIEGDDILQQVKQLCIKHQKSFELSNANVFRLVMIKADDVNRIMMTAHHAVVDAYSWQLMAQDLNNCFEQLVAGNKLELPAKLSSYQSKGDYLHASAESGKFLPELEYWVQQLNPQGLGMSYDEEVDGLATAEDVSYQNFNLSEEDTRDLFTVCKSHFATEINELLLSAMYMGLRRWRDTQSYRVFITNHGRQPSHSKEDYSHTVGWFIHRYPVRFDFAIDDLSELIKQIDGTLNSVPNDGLGYGVLRYLSKEPSLLELDNNQDFKINFNFQGKLGAATMEAPSLEFREEDVGSLNHPEMNTDLSSSLSFSGSVYGQKLYLWFAYDSRTFKKASMDKLAALVKESLLEIIWLSRK